MEKNYVDEVMCFMQGASKEAAIVRLGPVSMRMGVAGSCIVKPGKRLYALGDRKTEGQESIVAKVMSVTYQAISTSARGGFRRNNVGS